jgi:uncharacterized protein YecE (DUF72 family)
MENGEKKKVSKSPSDFVFTAKLPKLITHDKALGLKSDVKALLKAWLRAQFVYRLFQNFMPIRTTDIKGLYSVVAESQMQMEDYFKI